MLEDILSKLIDLGSSEYLKGYRIGIVGSYAREEVTEASDLDIVIDTDSLSFEQIAYIQNQFQIDVDVIALRLLEEEDRQLDIFTQSLGLPINEESAYKSICKEVIWCGEEF